MLSYKYDKLKANILNNQNQFSTDIIIQAKARYASICSLFLFGDIGKHPLNTLEKNGKINPNHRTHEAN